MKHLSTAALILASAPLLAQQTGVAHPAEIVEEAPIAQSATQSGTQNTEPQTTAIPVVTAPVTVVHGPVTVIAPGQTAVSQAALSQGGMDDTDASSPAVTLKRHDLAKFTPRTDPDDGIVESVAQVPGELPEGTILRARLRQTIQTVSTEPDTPFTAELTEPVQHMGRIVFPAGSVVEGRVTEIHGGRRFRGAAMIHLQAQTVVLPDGTRVNLHAAVVDTDQTANTRIDDEGNIKRKDNVKETLAVLSLATGSGAVAGAVVGGGVGALVGAGIGAGVSTVVWLKQDRQTELPADTVVVLALTTPLPIGTVPEPPEYVRTRPAAPALRERDTARPAPVPAQQSFVPAN